MIVQKKKKVFIMSFCYVLEGMLRFGICLFWNKFGICTGGDFDVWYLYFPVC